MSSANLPGFYPVRVVIMVTADLNINPESGVIGATHLIDAPVKWGFPRDTPEHVAEKLTEQLAGDITRIVEHIMRSGLENAEARKQVEQRAAQGKIQ